MATLSAPHVTSGDGELLCRWFGLGDPVGAPEPVSGARSHTMWSLTITRGRFAVKAFEPTSDHLRSLCWRRHLDDAIELEVAASAAGLPVPRPVPLAGTASSMLADLPTPAGTLTFRVHEWVDGRPIGDDTTAPELAATIGRILARVHALPVPCRHTKPLGLSHIPDDRHLLGLVRLARDGGHAWASALDHSRAAYQEVGELAAAPLRATWGLVTTHRDLSPKNVLVTESASPMIVDWDVAGPWAPEEETAAAAVEWGGALAGQPSRDAVRSLVAAYQQVAGPIAFPGRGVFAGWLVKHVNWTEMHIRHALDDSLPDHHRQAADHLVPELLDQLQRFTTGVTTWTRWIADA